MKLKLGIAFFAILVAVFVFLAFFIEMDGFSNKYEEQTTTAETKNDIFSDETATHPYGTWYIYRDESTGDAGLGRRDCLLENCDCYDMRTVSKDLAYSVNSDGKTCMITGIGKCPDSIFIIPFVIDGYEVVGIADEAFYGCSYMTGLAIPSTVIEIGAKAFYNCLNLGGVIIPEGTVSVCDSAFANCSKITEINIPASVTHIGQGAFANCSSLKRFSVNQSNMCYSVIDDNLYSKDGSVLIQHANAKRQSEFTTPDSVVKIESLAFAGSKNLVAINITNGVKSIGNLAFNNCTSLKNLNIPSTLETICDDTFDGCQPNYNEYNNSYYLGNSENPYVVLISTASQDITECEISDSTKFIYTNAFADCDSLTSVSIPDGIIYVGAGAFSGCSSLTSISLPKSIEYIGEEVFADSNSLNNISVDENCENYYSVDGNLYSSKNSSLVAYAVGKTDKEFSIPEGITTIEKYAFGGSTKLQTLYIPKSLTNIDSSVYKALRKIQSVEVATENENYKSENGNLLSKDGKTFLLYAKSKTDTEFSIPEGVTVVGKYAFANASNLTSVNIPNSVTTLEDGAFEYCSKLTSVIIPDSVTSIGNSVFWNCSSLTSVSLSNNISVIGESAFNGCKKLESIIIPNSVTMLGNSSFWNCQALTYAVIGSGVKDIEAYAFGNCESLKDIYYFGDASAWNNISKNKNNSLPAGVIPCLYSESAPTEEGSFWHYVENVPTKW